MTRRRFYAPPAAFAPDGAGVTLSEDETRHLRDVLRLRAGDEAFVFDGEGREFACFVTDAGGHKTNEAGGRGKSLATLEVRRAVEPPSRESPLALALAAALLKGEKFDLVVQKATELGVARIVPVAAKRADVRPRDERDSARRLERWRRLALEAAKQSGRARVPTVSAPAEFENFVSVETEVGVARLMFAERGGEPLGVEGAKAFDKDARAVSNIVALVGPEGGWDEDEIALAREKGWRIITLGGRVLRAETAGLVVCALLQNMFGDLK